MPGASSHPDQNSNIDIAGADAMAADGAIAIKNGTIVITKTSAAALTLALPTAGADDGKQLALLDVRSNIEVPLPQIAICSCIDR